MKNRFAKKVIGAAALIMLSTALLAGCGKEKEQSSERNGQSTMDTAAIDSEGTEAETESESGSSNAVGSQTAGGVTELEVRFGDNGAPFMMQLLDNETAAAIARYVGTSDWRLPIYERDDDADYDVMQYYDVSSRYDIPSDPETVTSEKAGEVYYSDPNRLPTE